MFQRSVRLFTVGFLLFEAALFSSAAEKPQVYEVDDAHSSVTFKVRHLIGKVSGRFTDFSGTITGSPENPEQASVLFTIKASSIDTGNEKRDGHLRSKDFFSVHEFPAITFKSASIQPSGEGRFSVKGEFTMHGVTRNIEVPVSFNGTARDPWGNERAGFEIEMTLDRKDYGITWNKTLDQGGLMLGDEVQVMIEIEAVRK